MRKTKLAKKPNPASNALFYAKAKDGYIIKMLFDALLTAMQRTSFRVNKKGFYNRSHDEKTQILFDVCFKRRRFSMFRCHKEMEFSINLKHAQRMIRNVKKKDAVVMFIKKKDNGEPGDKLWVKIMPATGGDERSETVCVTITHNPIIKTPLALPEYSVSEDGKEMEVYGFPKKVPAQGFQKFKKMTGVGKEAVVEIQKNNYISFYSCCGELYSSELEFGTIVENPESSDEMTQADSDDDHHSADESESESEEESEETEEETEEDEDNDEGEEGIVVRGWYKEKFDMKLFGTLLKLHGLCSEMEFYAPRVKRYPLKVSVDAGKLGRISVYIKDKKQVDYEEEKKREKKT